MVSNINHHKIKTNKIKIHNKNINKLQNKTKKIKSRKENNKIETLIIFFPFSLLIFTLWTQGMDVMN